MAAVAMSLIEVEAEDDYAEAEAILAALAAEYPAYARADLDQMKLHLEAITARNGDAADEIEGLFHVAHNVKGQGSSFGYDLMTHLGDELCGIVRERRSLGELERRRVRDLIEACDTVLNTKLVGDGGMIGQALLDKVSVSLPAS